MRRRRPDTVESRGFFSGAFGRPNAFKPSPSRGGWVGMVLVLGSVFGVFARTHSRPCVVCPPSMAASYFLLLAQKKVTKEKGTLGFAPSPKARVRYGRTGSAHRPSMACCPNRRDPSRRPRAVHAAGPSTLRRCSEGTRRAKAHGFRLSPE